MPVWYSPHCPYPMCSSLQEGSKGRGVVEEIDGSLGASGPASIFELSSSFISTAVVDCGLELGRSVPSSTPVDCVDAAIGQVWGMR